ncbi:MAG TPA: ATP-binding protein [Gemmatimonadaceae bacterium]|nr:ATP-binding protein [Gemmatimonadaceae bacterium]
MFESVRARLALWHTATLGALLVMFAAATYVFVGHAIRQRMDRYLAETASAFGAELQAERLDESTNERAVTEAVREFRFRDVQVVVLDSSLQHVLADGAREATDDSTTHGRPRGRRAVRATVLASALAKHQDPDATLVTVTDDARHYRAFAAPVRLEGERYIVAVVESLRGQEETMVELRTAYLIAIPLALILAGTGGYALARRSLAPVAEMSVRATRIGAANPHERLPVVNPRDELGQLAQTLNGLLSRLAGALDQQRRFMADASHELRTPVAIMRGEADIALASDSRSAGEYREAMAVIGDEGKRLSNIVDDLFLLARADAGQTPVSVRELYLDELVAECVRAVRSLAAQRGVELCCAPLPESPYRGDEELLRRVLLNLLDNAIKYSDPGARVQVALDHDAHDAAYRIVVSDTGPGIPADAQARLFERFYRADRARSRSVSSATGGAGLGLAIGRMVAEAHGGRLELVRSSADGSEFALTLPVALSR